MNQIYSKIKRMSLTWRVVTFNLGISFIAVAFFVGISFYFANKNIREGTFATLDIIRENQASALERYFKSHEKNLSGLANSYVVARALPEFKTAFRELRAELGSNEAVTARLKRDYIAQNPYPTGAKEKLDAAADGSGWSEAHRRYHPFFRAFLKTHRYYDIFLVDPDSGHLIYTVFKEQDFATGLLDGPYKDTNIARVFRRARASTTPGEVFFEDFEYYAPSDEPAAFMATALIENGVVQGVLIMQFDVDELNEIMNNRLTLQNAHSSQKSDFNMVDVDTQAYLLGADMFMRSDPTDFKKQQTPGYKTKILSQKVESDITAEAFRKGAAAFGNMIYRDYRGIRVLGTYRQLNLNGLEYVLISEVNYNDATRSQRFLILLWSFLGLITMVLVILGTIYLARQISQPINTAVNTISTSSREIAATVDQQERTTNQQSASVNQTTTTMSELGSSSQQTAEQSESVATGAQETLELAENGSHLVEDMLNNMSQLKTRVSAIAERILQLSDHVNQIGNITNLVSEIANETNMLALNAAVEAVRAGENGKGFAVVATEIRKLADQSKKSAEQIQGIIGDIQKATDSTVMVTDEGTKAVDQGVDLARETAKSFGGVTEAMNRVFENTQQISLNVKQQAIAIGEVLEAMNVLNTGARESAAGVAQTKEGIHQLDESAQTLKSLVRGAEN